MKEELLDTLTNTQISISKLKNSIELDQKTQILDDLYEVNKDFKAIVDLLIEYSNKL